jgi:hypothetical protein
MGQVGASEVNMTLEVVKLVVAVTIPIIVAVIAFRLNKVLHVLAAGQWANQKVVEKRIVIFDEVAPAVNDLYCFFKFVGDWKELTPAAMVAAKRRIDKRLYVYAALFPKSLINTYNKFIHLCFKPYVGAGHDAQLRTVVASAQGDRRKSSKEPWDVSWETLFVADAADVADTRTIQTAYFDLMNEFSTALGIGIGRPRPGTS